MPDPERRIIRNTFWLLAGEVLARLLAAGYQVLLARYLGRMLFGEFTLAMALAALLGVFADLGLSSLTVREVSRDRENPWRIAAGALRARAVLTLALGGLAIGTSALAGQTGRATALLAILAGTQFVQGQGDVLTAAHRGRERVAFPVALAFLSRLGLVLSGVAAVWLGASILAFATLTAVWALPMPLLLPRGLPRADGPTERATVLLRRALPIGIGLALWAFYFRVDLILVGLLRGDRAAGLYGAAFRLVEACLLLSGPLLAAAMPLLSSRDPQNPESRRVFHLIVRMFALVAAPLALVFAIEGEGILATLFGAGYTEARFALLILGFAIPVSFLAAPFLTLLISRDREREYALIMLAGALLKPALAVWFIGKHGIVGAAAATLAAEFVVLVLALVRGDRLASFAGLPGILVRTLVCGVVLWAALNVGRLIGIPFGLRIGLGLLVVYPAAAIGVRAVRRKDLGVFRSAIGKGK